MAKFQDLPPDSQPWGQGIEGRVLALETALSNLNTLVGGSNARLGALLNQQAALLDQQATLLTQQGQISSQVSFLSGQYDYNATDGALAGYSLTGPRTGFSVPFDNATQALLSFTTSGSGVVALEAQAGWSVYPSANTALSINWELYVEILNAAGTQIKGRSTGAPLSTVIQNIPAATGFSNTAGGTLTTLGVLYLTPNTFYTARTRLYANNLNTGNDIFFAPLSLKLTKLGI
jgi:hypothetical protein